MNQRQKLTNLFQQGVELTEKQITQRTGAKAPRALIHALRHEDGMAIYANRRVDTAGRVTTKYRLGTPSRAVVAAGYRAMGA